MDILYNDFSQNETKIIVCLFADVTVYDVAYFKTFVSSGGTQSFVESTTI